MLYIVQNDNLQHTDSDAGLASINNCEKVKLVTVKPKPENIWGSCSSNSSFLSSRATIANLSILYTCNAFKVPHPKWAVCKLCINRNSLRSFCCSSVWKAQRDQEMWAQQWSLGGAAGELPLHSYPSPSSLHSMRAYTSEMEAKS